MKKAVSMAMGLVLASGVSTAAFADVKAVPSPQKVFVNGEQIEVKAFNIDGSNYFNLRDLGMHLNFVVEFDKETNSVKIVPAAQAGEKPAEQKPAEQKPEEQKPEEKPAEKPAEEITSLKPWEGTWNSIALYLDDKALDEAYAEKAKKEKKTASEIKDGKKEIYASPVMNMVISEDKVKYFEGKLTKEGGAGDLLGEDTYKYMGQVPMGKGNWSYFEATNENPKYKYLLFTKVHGEDMPHFHIRFSNKGMDDIKAQKSYPTFIKFNTTIEQLKEEIAE